MQWSAIDESRVDEPIGLERMLLYNGLRLAASRCHSLFPFSKRVQLQLAEWQHSHDSWSVMEFNWFLQYKYCRWFLHFLAYCLVSKACFMQESCDFCVVTSKRLPSLWLLTSIVRHMSWQHPGPLVWSQLALRVKVPAEEDVFAKVGCMRKVLLCPPW